VPKGMDIPDSRRYLSGSWQSGLPEDPYRTAHGGEITFSQLIVQEIKNKKLRKSVTLIEGDEMKF